MLLWSLLCAVSTSAVLARYPNKAVWTMDNLRHPLCIGSVQACNSACKQPVRLQVGSFETARLSLHDYVKKSSDDGMSAHKTIYDFAVKDANGEEVSLSKYKGNVVIVVNVASQCGFTNNHYTELKQLQDKYYDQGLRIAAFPCNQFAGQEPSCEADIKKFVKETYDYEPDLYAKVNVNGDKADPFWTFLKTEQGGTLIDAIKWNFTKFLINRKGHVVKRFAPTTSPMGMKADIESLLEESP